MGDLGIVRNLSASQVCTPITPQLCPLQLLTQLLAFEGMLVLLAQVGSDILVIDPELLLDQAAQGPRLPEQHVVVLWVRLHGFEIPLLITVGISAALRLEGRCEAGWRGRRRGHGGLRSCSRLVLSWGVIVICDWGDNSARSKLILAASRGVSRGVGASVECIVDKLCGVVSARGETGVGEGTVRGLRVLRGLIHDRKTDGWNDIVFVVRETLRKNARVGVGDFGERAVSGGLGCGHFLLHIAARLVENRFKILGWRSVGLGFRHCEKGVGSDTGLRRAWLGSERLEEAINK